MLLIKFNKKMKDSYMEDYLPFKSDPVLLDEYIFSNGKIRTGKLLEGKKLIWNMNGNLICFQ
jgi:acyl-coenzyme A thioesterase 9